MIDAGRRTLFISESCRTNGVRPARWSASICPRHLHLANLPIFKSHHLSQNPSVESSKKTEFSLLQEFPSRDSGTNVRFWWDGRNS